MRRMKRWGTAALAGMMAMSVLAGCGQKQTEPAVTTAAAAKESQETQKPEEAAAGDSLDELTKKQPDGDFQCTPEFIGWENAEIELTWQPNPSHSMNSGSEAKTNYLIDRCSQWVKDHPNVKIKVVGTTNNINDNMAKLRLEVVEGTESDVVAVDSFMVNMFKDYAQPLDKALEENGISIDDFFPFAKANMTNDKGEVICFQYTTDTRALFYRKDLIPEPPKTVDELIKVGKEMADQGYVGMITAAGRNETSVNNHWGLYWSQGAKLLKDDGTIAFDEGSDKEAMLNYLKYFENLVKDGIMPSRAVDYTSDKATYGEIASGNVAMAVEASSAVAQLQEVLGKDEFDSKWAIAPLPVFKESDTSTSSAGGWTFMVFTKDETKQKLAADFSLYVYGDDDGMAGWCAAGGYLPTRMSVFENADAFKNDPYAQTFEQYLKVATARPSAETYTIVSEKIQIAIGEIITGTKTAEEALDEAIAAIKNN